MNYIIKNMKGYNCKEVIINELQNLNINYSSVEIGELKLNQKIAPNKKAFLKDALLKVGFEVIDDKRIILTEKIKSIIIKLVHETDEWPNTNFSVYLCNKIDYHYTYLANLFSEVQGITIARFIMTQKIEKVKKLILKKEYNLKEIASIMNYSSVAHLSSQFKKVANISPSHFKNMKVAS